MKNGEKMSEPTTTLMCPTSGCGHSPFPVTLAFKKRAHRTHERFYCPAGHRQYFPGESDIEQLKRKLKEAKLSVAWFKDQADRDARQADREARACPWVQCYFQGKTVRAAHGMPTQAEVLVEAMENDDMEAAQ